MAWVNPRTWVAGELVTAAQLNAQLRDNMVDLDARAAQALVFDNTQLGNGASTAESIIHAYTIPANTLDTNGKTIHLHAVGVFAADASSKLVRVRLGGLSGTVGVVLGGTTTTNGQPFWVDVWVSRIASNSQRVSGDGYFPGSEQFGNRQTMNATAARTDSSPIDLVVTGEAASGFANEIVYLSSWIQTLG